MDKTMELLKAIFGDKALTFSELEAALKDNKELKLANLAEGGYVGKEKFEALDKLKKKGYNCNRVSKYAAMSKFRGQWDEIYTEYRVYKMLGG